MMSVRRLHPASFGSLAALALTSIAALTAPACSGGDSPTSTSSTGGSGPATTSTTQATVTSSAVTTGATTASTSVSSGNGGAGGMAPCNPDPPNATAVTIPQVWAANPAMATDEWVPGVYVTGVSGAGCAANLSCQIFVQQDETYASLTAAAQKSIKIDITPALAGTFTGIAVGDKIDVHAHALRDTTNGQNELKFLVSGNLEGCAKVVGSGNPTPITTTLDMLTVDLYNNDGPVLLTVDLVTGRPHQPNETFALWTTGTPPGTDITKVTSMSPFFLTGGAFTGFTPEQITQFGSVTGVFGLFQPMGPTVYKEIYIRSMAEAPTL